MRAGERSVKFYERSAAYGTRVGRRARVPVLTHARTHTRYRSAEAGNVALFIALRHNARINSRPLLITLRGKRVSFLGGNNGKTASARI